MIDRRAAGRMIVGGMIGAMAAARLPAQPFVREMRRAPATVEGFAGLLIGCNSYSFGIVPVADAINGIAQAGLNSAELHPRQLEPQLAGGLVFEGADIAPASQALARYNRDLLRRWRLQVPLELYAAVRRRFDAANITLRAFNMNYRDDFTDAELDRTFLMAQALKVDLISAVGSNAVLRRLDPFARKHRVRVGMHNETNLPNVAAFEEVINGMSDYMGYTLDIGHFTSTGGDSMEMLRKHHGRIFNVHLKDRKRNAGPTVPFGQGDAPLAEALRWMRDNQFKAPANIEQEAAGWDRESLVRESVSFVRKVLAA